MKPYNPKSIEPKWQKIWQDTKLYEAKDDSQKSKYYALEFFPYPSGATLHVGHVRNYTINDAWARYQRMLGKNVLHPMGWDAFGLPAENYAIKNGVSPRQSTDANIKVFKRQFKQLGFSYDWSRELDSSRPDYYQWTQWLFLYFYKQGLAYRKEATVNWCPQDKTVLANEQVIGEKNVCERCGTPVVQKQMEQWFFKITSYAERLLNDLDDLDWPESIKIMQRNWIGKSQGTLVKFQVEGSKDFIEVYTTRVDTLFSGTFIILAPEYEGLPKLTKPKQAAAIKKYVQTAQRKTELDRLEETKSKTGVFTGSHAINPANGERMPVWVADFVLGGYGTGAVFGDGHDERDVQFANKYKIPLKTSLEPVTGTPQKNPEFRRSIVAIVRNPKTKKLLSINWGKDLGGHLFVGGGVEEGEDLLKCAEREIAEETGYQNVKLVAQTQNIHHHYFAASKNKARQILATGLLFDLVNDAKTKPKLEKDEQGKMRPQWLNVEQADQLVSDELHHYVFSNLIKGEPFTGEGILYNSGQFDGLSSADAKTKITKWLAGKKLGQAQTQYRLRDWLVSRQRYWGAPIPIIYCKQDGIVPVPAKDLPVVLPESVEFKPTGQSPLVDIKEFVNTKCPKCGRPAKRETDTMDTFLDSSWYFLRFTDPHNNQEPFAKAKADYWMAVDMYVGGAEHAVMHLLYARFWNKVLHDGKLVKQSEPFQALRNQGLIGGADGRKMGKRYNNAVTPDDIIASGYGADALRAYELFIAPFDQAVPWDPQGIVGTRRFLDRAWNLLRQYQREISRPAEKADNQAVLETQLVATTHKAVKKVTTDVESFSFNTAVAALMELVNSFYKLKEELPFATAVEVWQPCLETLLKLLAPIAPHITEELWQELDHQDSIHVQPWPNWDARLVTEDIVTLVVQVNGKVRANISVPAGISKDAMVKQAKADTKVKSYLKQGKLVKTITVPGKLVNFVLA